MIPHPSLRHTVTTMIGVVICGWTAALLCVLLRGHHAALMLPIVFIAIVTLIAIRFGVSAGVLGAVLSALIFAVFLYKPLGSVVVENPSARMNLAWLIVGGLACSYLLASGGRGPQQHE